MLGKIWNIIEKIVSFVIIKFAKIFKKEVSDEQLEAFLQFIKFGMVGVSNTCLSYVIYYIGLFMGLNYQLSNAVGYFVGICNSFYWNNKYVFKEKEGEKRSLVKAFIKCFTSYLGGYAVSVIILFVWVRVLNLSEFIAPIINIIVTVPLNFILNKLWAFKAPKEKA